MSKKDLVQASRDPRGWDGAHPEREAYGAWVGETWRALDEAGALDGDGTTVVQVKGYHRTRNGRREWVGPYEQTRKAAEAGNDNAALVEVRGEEPASAALPPVAGAASQTQVATIFIGGGGDGKSQIVSNFVTNTSQTGFRQRFSSISTEYFSWDQQADIERYIRGLRAQNPSVQIHLVGHSYGGDTAAQIAASMAGRGQKIGGYIRA